MLESAQGARLPVLLQAANPVLQTSSIFMKLSLW